MKTKILGSLLVATLLFSGCASKQPVPDLEGRLEVLKKSYDSKIIDESTFKKLQSNIIDGDDTGAIFTGDRLISLRDAYDNNALSVEEYHKLLNRIIDGKSNGKKLIGDELTNLKNTFSKGLINVDEYAKEKSAIINQ
ncbi:MAG: hypothetical protein U9N42_03030 [Campylobacterota bacterium]|nr:hypothetical protein [Campylobacterota bacterium]